MKKGTDRQFSGEWEIIVAKNFEEIEAIREIWEQMQCSEPCPTPNADIDIYLSTVKPGSEDVRPCIILVKQNGEPRALLVGRCERHPLNIRLGYKTLFSPKLKCLSVVYGGILGRPYSNVYSLLIKEMSRMLRDREVDLVFMNHLRVDSDAYGVMTTKPGFLCRGWLPENEKHWSVSLPETMDELYMRYSPKNRSNLRRLIKRLEKAYPDRIKVVTYTKEDQVQKTVEVMAEISAKTYQSQLNSGFVDNEYTRDMLKLAAKRGWLRACVLFIEEEPAAFELALRYEKSYFGLHTGFDPKWKRFRVGTVLFLNFLKSICGDPAAKSFDFGFGDAEYKRLYSDQCWREASVYIFAPRLYPIFINVLRSSTMAVDAGLRYIVNKIGAVGWIKRHWRDSLQAKNPAGNC